MNLRIIAWIPAQILLWVGMFFTAYGIIKLTAPFMVAIGILLEDEDANFPKWLYWYDNQKDPTWGWGDRGQLSTKPYTWRTATFWQEWYYRGIRNGGSNFMRYIVSRTPEEDIFRPEWSHTGFTKGPKRWAYGPVYNLDECSNWLFRYEVDTKRPWLARASWTYLTDRGFYLMQYAGWKLGRSEGNGFTFRVLPIYYKDEGKA